MSAGSPDRADAEQPARAETDTAGRPPPTLPLLTLRDGLPDVVETPESLTEACRTLAAASGPVAIDAERASGYRYSARAYLVQLRRDGAGTYLIDPTTFPDLAPLQEALEDAEWILHAATQDLPCLREVGLEPAALFDTELAGRLLGFPRVGLATLVETLLGRRMRKEHSAADWSTRPLPTPWLEYAALDVEALIELRAVLVEELENAGKDAWAREEFEYLLGFEPAVRAEPWRRMSGVHKLRGRRAMGAARALWEARDAIAAERDVTPSRIVPDAALVAAASAQPTDVKALLGTQGFHGRGASRYSRTWMRALDDARRLAEDELPTRAARTDGPPHPRTWAERDPVADRRFKTARAALVELAEGLALPVENLITPDFVRRAMWSPPEDREEEALRAALGDQLAGYGARAWQVERVVPPLARAVLEAEETQET